MKLAEKTELVLISMVVAGIAVFNGQLPARMQSGYFILTLGLLFLFQALLRDLWLLLRMRKTPRDSMPQASCMCLEAGIGFIPVIVAAVLVGGGYSRAVDLSALAWIGAVAVVLLIGLWLKDYVFELRPFRIRRDPDHINFIFSLNRKHRLKNPLSAKNE